MKYHDTNFPLKARTNKDFSMAVDVGFSITGLTPKFSIKKPDGTIVDLSQYCTILTDTSFGVLINADTVKTTIGAITATYDMIIDKGNGSKEFLFSGSLKVDDGISV